MTQGERLEFTDEPQATDTQVQEMPVITVTKEYRERVETAERFQPSITGAEIENLRQAFRESLSEFGVRLKRAINPKAPDGYTRQYVSRIEHGKDVITKEIEYAYWEIKRGIDRSTVGEAGAVLVYVKARPNQVPEGALIPRSAVAMKCFNPTCSVVFIKTHPRQKYHDPECKRK